MVLNSRKQKAAKDLYYIFDLLSGLSGIREQIDSEFDMFSEKHPKWFRTYLKNLRIYFKSLDSEGSLSIVEQRPADAFPGLDDDQLRQFAHATFLQFIEKFESI